MRDKERERLYMEINRNDVQRGENELDHKVPARQMKLHNTYTQGGR